MAGVHGVYEAGTHPSSHWCSGAHVSCGNYAVAICREKQGEQDSSTRSPTCGFA